jgi:hypothetical protein
MAQHGLNITIAFLNNCNFTLCNLLMTYDGHIMDIKLRKLSVLFGVIHRFYRHVMKINKMKNLALLLSTKTMKSTGVGT